VELRRLISSGPSDPQESSQSLDELLSAGLLTTDIDAGRALAAINIEPAAAPLVEADAVTHAHVSFGHLWNFLVASSTALIRRRLQSLEEVANIVEKRKMQAAQEPFDVEKARELTTIFHKVRFFFPVDYVCLYDSLALIEFLARYKIFPTWIFGVTLEPWGAHCWVQHRGFVFNEGVEEAANYTPILAI
jgi:hypothetical protein